jgi:prevent-host-death family protein
MRYTGHIHQESLMHVVELQQAEQHLAQLIAEAAAGDRIVIASAGKPLAMLSAYVEPSAGLPLWQGTVIGELRRCDF